MSKFKRRNLLKLSGVTSAVAALAACQPLREDEWLLIRTLQHISFGPRPHSFVANTSVL